MFDNFPLWPAGASSHALPVDLLYIFLVALSAVTTLAIYGVVLGVDGVALKQAVNAWASAPEAEKAARFAVAEGMRWLEWGTRSYENFTLGLAVLLFAVAMARTARLPRPIPYLMGLSALAYWVQGWSAGTEGFSQTHSIAIVMGEVLNAAWMVWLLAAARQMAGVDGFMTVPRSRPG